MVKILFKNKPEKVIVGPSESISQKIQSILQL